MKEIRQEVTPDVWDPLFGNMTMWGAVGTRHINMWLAHNAAFDRPFVENRLEVFEHKAWACSFAGIDWKAERKANLTQ